MPTDLRPDAGTKFGFRDPAAEDEPIECEVLAVEPERSIRFSWRDAEARRDGLDSTVTFEIAATPAGGTHLTIVHEVRHAAGGRAAMPPRWRQTTIAPGRCGLPPDQLKGGIR